MFSADQQVQHASFGTGIVLLDQGETVVVRFGDRIEACAASDLTRRLSLEDAISTNQWASLADVRLKSQATAIRSLNDAWGVFSRSRIDLLPHQLWVCHRALKSWPIRLLIADDVGLGKTVEAGLILWPLLSSGRVRRLLILTPASLVRQWQYRLKALFDIRMSIYEPRIDTPRTDYWTIHNQVVASLPTLRTNRNERHERILEAPPWDMLIVDEAHHLNVDERTGKTLSYELVERLNNEGRVESCVFFTGTPHRGKPYGFWSLMGLLRPDLFDPRRPEAEQLPSLRNVMIRNFKPKVTDMAGRRLFQPVTTSAETYSYTADEHAFYEQLTRFILAGNAYASELDRTGRRQVMLVLIAMQKIASSSVAAIRAALRKRLARIERDLERYRQEQLDVAAADEDDVDVFGALERWWSKENFKLMEDEIPHLMSLLDAATAIEQESKIARIRKLIRDRFADRSVLLFTEYKATQALMVSTLMESFGQECVGFINGDDRLEGVRLPSGMETTLSCNRERTAERFNTGRIRFLVSTEAAGEGIDLQSRCHTVIHIDLPWNPMRLHQRVGRLNRYGQRYPVDVVTVRNPATVESRIWDKLEKKLGHIMQALGHAMDEPEDLMQMVLGMAGPGFFNEVFSEGAEVGAERLDQWFDAKTRTLGGRSAIETVTDLVGQCQSFDLSELADVPRKDLPDLVPFFQGMLVWNRRRREQGEEAFTFRTPEVWQTVPGIRSRYEGLIFRRDVQDDAEAKRIVGIGHQVFDRALIQAGEWEASLGLIPSNRFPLALFRFRDAVTTESGQVRQILVGVTEDVSRGLRLIRDEEVLEILNSDLAGAKEPPRSSVPSVLDRAGDWLKEARGFASETAPSVDLPFRKPIVEDLALFWPASDDASLTKTKSGAGRDS